VTASTRAGARAAARVRVATKAATRRRAGEDEAASAEEESDGPRERLLIRVPRERGGELAAALRAAHGILDARRAGASLRIQLDPATIG
jgi:primosomal protein N' (replication factor Y)